MQIRQTSNRSLLLSSLVIASLITLTLMHNNISTALYEGERHRALSYSLADQLRQGIEKLTHMARTYVATANPEHLKSIEHLRAAQQDALQLQETGELNTEVQPDAAIETKATIKLENGGAVTPSEWAKLLDSLRYAGRLTALEDEAFALLDAGKQSDAIQMLHSEAYQSAKFLALNPIDEFLIAVDQRTDDEAALFVAKKEQLFRNYGFLLFIIVAATALEFFWGTKKIVAPIEELTRAANGMAEGDYQQRAIVSSDTEIGVLATTFNEMARSIEQDIEERKRSTEEIESLRQKAEERSDELEVALGLAEQATKAKAAFLATMSHEIRTPMNGVIGMIDLLQQTKLTDDQGEMVDTVRSSAYALLTIINDILDFSKIEAGKVDLESVPISICDAVEGVAETLSTTARNKNISLRSFVDPTIPDAVLGDQVRIRQILFNLAGNAVKFTEKGGVQIRADRVDDGSTDDVSIRIQIIDTGIGLTEEGKANLFKAFTQAESSTTRRFGGTGLGLTICQRLVELMNSQIDVESVFGEGSTFGVTLTLPVAKEHTLKSDGHDLSDLRILFVENDSNTHIYLEKWGAKVTFHEGLDDLKEALLTSSKEGNPYNIVYMDVDSRAATCRKIVEEIQAQPEIENTRFVLGSALRKREGRLELDNTLYIETCPQKRAAVIRTFAVAAGRASPDVVYDDSHIPDEVMEPLSVEEAENAGQLILLAEDNLTNQKVILRQLNNLGYAADIANDGVEALEALNSKSYAILLTDCHMPNLDGFDLTKTIRSSEMESGRERLPIIAITASALKAEVDHCYEVGMDDFLSKPVEVPKLHAALRKWMPGVSPGKPVAKEEEAPEPAPQTETAEAAEEPHGVEDGGMLDLKVLTDIFGDDEETIKEILNDYVGPSKECCSEIEQAFTSQSSADVGAGAHKLKSSSRSIGANELADLCAELEVAGKSDDWDKINTLYPQLPGLAQTVFDYIESL